MQDDSPNKIQIEELPGITRWRLPRRDMSAHRKVGWTGVGIGTMVGLFMLFWMSGPLIRGIQLLWDGQLFGIGPILFACSGLLGLGMALMIVSFGIAVLNNKTFSQIEIRGQRLISREYFGPISMRLVNLKFDQIKQLTISPMPQEWFGQGENSFKIDVQTDWFVLRAEATVPVKRPPLLATAYPSELLQEVAQMIKIELSRHSATPVKGSWLESTATNFNQSLVTASSKHPATVSGSHNQELPIVVVTDESEAPPVRPASCQVEIVRVLGQPTVFRLPPQGFRGPARGLLTFACIWNVFVLVIFGLIITSMINEGRFGDLLPGLFIILLFLAVGLYVLYFAFNVAKRTAMIGIDADTLFCETKELFRKSWTEIPRKQIQSIVVGPSGTSLNDVPLMQIQITQTPPSGHVTRLFTGLPEDELAWVRHELLREIQTN